MKRRDEIVVISCGLLQRVQNSKLLTESVLLSVTTLSTIILDTPDSVAAVQSISADLLNRSTLILSH